MITISDFSDTLIILSLEAIVILLKMWLFLILAMTSDLMVFNALLRLAMCLLENSMNLALFLLLIRMITCFLDGLFVVIFILGFNFPTLLMILWILSILLAYNLEKHLLDFQNFTSCWYWDLSIWFTTVFLFCWFSAFLKEFGNFFNFLRRFCRDQQ